MRNNDGFVCVYAINDRKTFENLDDLIEQVKRVKDAERVPLVIVGNKVLHLKEVFFLTFAVRIGIRTSASLERRGGMGERKTSYSTNTSV